MPRLPVIPGSNAAAAPRGRSDVPITTTVRSAGSGAAGVPGDTTSARMPVGRQASVIPTPRRQLTMERRAVIAVVAIVAGIMGAAAVSRSISDVIDTRAQVAAAQALNDSIRAEVEAGQREVEFAQGETYRRFASRGLGYGRGREEAFALRDGAPPPPSITPLGSGQDLAAEDPLAGFLDLLLQP